MDPKQFKFYSKYYSKSILNKVDLFLNENKYELFNLAYLGDGDWRVMYQDKDKIVKSQLFQWPELEENLTN